MGTEVLVVRVVIGGVVVVDFRTIGGLLVVVVVDFGGLVVGVRLGGRPGTWRGRRPWDRRWTFRDGERDSRILGHRGSARRTM